LAEQMIEHPLQTPVLLAQFDKFCVKLFLQIRLKAIDFFLKTIAQNQIERTIL